MIVGFGLYFVYCVSMIVGNECMYISKRVHSYRQNEKP